MFNIAFNSLSEVFLMQSQNGQNHGIFVWSVVVIVFISILATFIFYKMNIKKISKKLK
jgi:heme exporter protein D|tara:strand:- start:489 stop:662 length:174 start_codon:yes stop_codon:yes gene_type:complete